MPQPKIVVAMKPQLRADFFRARDFRRLQDCGVVTISPSPLDHSTPAARAALLEAEIVITGWGTAAIDAEVLRGAPRLGAIVHTAGSVRDYVTPAVYERGVRVSSQTAANAEPVAEYTLAMILLAAKDTLRAARMYAAHRAEIDRSASFPTSGLFGQRIGIIGLSRISRRVIDLLRPFDVEILVHSKHLTSDEATKLGVRAVPLDELMATSKVVSLHSASSAASRHLLGADEFASMTDGSTFINTARGAIVNQDALIVELATGRIDAVLDVADPDVTVAGSPLWDLPNVLLTPHFAGAVGVELHRLGRDAVIDVEHFIAGKLMPGEISAEQYRWSA